MKRLFALNTSGVTLEYHWRASRCALSGFASMQITAVLGITASTYRPYLRERARGEKVGGVYVAYQEEAWVNSSLLVA